MTKRKIIKKQKKENVIYIRVTDAQKLALERMANVEQISMSAVIRKILRIYFRV